MARQQINVDDAVDRWRWVCPAGHRSWVPTNEHFWCRYCARDPALDGEFTELRDKRTGETYTRDAIALETEAGSYRDVFGEGGAP